MKEALRTELIKIDDLRVGMFIHLDMSWLAHPFPLGSFKITSEAQLRAVRSLGVDHVRWSHSLSDAPPSDVADAPDLTVDRSQVEGGPAGNVHRLPSSVPAYPAEAEDAERRRLRKQRLVEQRAGLVQCERQFAEAANACKQMTEVLHREPVEARLLAESLSRALVQKMLAERELCIRLLTEAAGDKASSHALNVTIIALLMARCFGLQEAEMLDVGVGALLHDIGKQDLPERIRYRDDQFSGAELRFYEEHVAHGVAHGRKMGLSPGSLLVIAQHHENADGSGFPLRLNTDRMTIAARIVALVNRYDNLCNPIWPSKALTPHEAVSYLFAQGKSKFDTAILGAFIRMMGVYPAGSPVQLTDDRYALVVGVNSTRPLKPRVLVHDPKVPRDEALILDLESAHGLGIRRSVKLSHLPDASLAYLSPRPRVAYFFESAGHRLDASLAA